MSCCNNNCNHDPCGSSFNQAVTRAAQYAQYAQTQANAAAQSAEDANDTWLEFNALYLGAFAVAPTTDNEGNPLQNGALYFNSVSNQMFVWQGGSWIDFDFDEFTPFLATGTPTARNLVTRTADVTNVLDFGADPTGVNDSYAAVLAAVSASKGTLYFPTGTYKISNGIQINKSINIFGDGTASKIIFVGSNTLFQLLYQYPNPPRYQIESLSIFSDNVISDCCIELKYTGGPGVLGGEDALYMSNVFINCDANFYWKKALFMNRSAGVYISNSSFVNGNSSVAQSTPGVIGIHVLNDLVGHNIIRALHISNTYIQRFYQNINLENSAGNNIESVYIVNAELLGSKGIVGTGSTHAISIISTHFDQIISAIDLSGGANVRIESCDIRSGYTSTEPLVSIGSLPNTFSDLISIVGSQFVFTNPKAIRFLSGNQKIVASNVFFGNLSVAQVAISIEGNSGFTRCYGNQYTNVANAYSNTSTGGAVQLGVTGTFNVSVKNNISIADGIVYAVS